MNFPLVQASVQVRGKLSTAWFRWPKSTVPSACWAKIDVAPNVGRANAQTMAGTPPVFGRCDLTLNGDRIGAGCLNMPNPPHILPARLEWTTPQITRNKQEVSPTTLGTRSRSEPLRNLSRHTPRSCQQLEGKNLFFSRKLLETGSSLSWIVSNTLLPQKRIADFVFHTKPGCPQIP